MAVLDGCGPTRIWAAALGLTLMALEVTLGLGRPAAVNVSETLPTAFVT